MPRPSREGDFTTPFSLRLAASPPGGGISPAAYHAASFSDRRQSRFPLYRPPSQYAMIAEYDMLASSAAAAMPQAAQADGLRRTRIFLATSHAISARKKFFGQIRR